MLLRPNVLNMRFKATLLGHTFVGVLVRTLKVIHVALVLDYYLTIIFK
jgi:hypothetical protein